MTHPGWRGRNKRGVWISDTQQMKTSSASDFRISTGILMDVMIRCVKGGTQDCAGLSELRRDESFCARSLFLC